MNFKMKALVAAAVVATTMSGAANALTNNEIFLVAYDATAAKTFVAALGQAGTAQAFTGGTNLSINYAADANWVNLMSTATAGSVSYQVLGFYNSNPTGAGYAAGDKLLVSSTTAPNSFTNSQMNTLMGDVVIASGNIGLFESMNAAVTGTSTGLVTGGGLDSGAIVNTNVFARYNSFNATAALGADLGFYSLTRPTATTNPIQQIKTQYLTNGVGSVGDTWNLNAAGQLTYTATAAVPEADSWAMAMLGLGLMGFVARRRTRA